MKYGYYEVAGRPQMAGGHTGILMKNIFRWLTGLLNQKNLCRYYINVVQKKLENSIVACIYTTAAGQTAGRLHILS